MKQGGRHAQCTDCSRPHKADGGTASASHIPGASNPNERFGTGMEHRGNRDVNGQESCALTRPAWAFSLSRASTRHSGSGTGRELRCPRCPFTKYLWREADISDSLTTGPLRDEPTARRNAVNLGAPRLRAGLARARSVRVVRPARRPGGPAHE